MTNLTFPQRLQVWSATGETFDITMEPQEALKLAKCLEKVDAALAQCKVAKARADKAAWLCMAAMAANGLALAWTLWRMGR